MATCRYCGNSGFFLSVNHVGLCNKCDLLVKDLFLENQHKLTTNQIYLDDPADFEDLKRTITDLRECLRVLVDLKNRGFLTVNSNPEILLGTLETKHDIYYKKLFQWEFDQLAVTVANMKIRKAQLNRVENFLDDFDKYKSYLKDPSCLDALLKKAKKLKGSFSG
jgi:hypothetical protein